MFRNLLQVLALDKRYLDPRRSVNPTQAEKEEGVIPLTDSLPIIPQVCWVCWPYIIVIVILLVSWIQCYCYCLKKALNFSFCEQWFVFITQNFNYNIKVFKFLLSTHFDFSHQSFNMHMLSRQSAVHAFFGLTFGGSMG